MMLAATTAEIKKWVVVNANFKPENLIPSSNEMKKYIIEVLGKDAYDSLLANYADNSLTSEQAELLPYVQKALVNLSMWHFANFGDMEISSSGFHINTSNDRKTAFQWQILKAKRMYANTGFNALEELLEFLWTFNNATFPQWESSTERAESLQFFCNSAKEFSKYYNIKNSYALFREMRDTISLVEDKYIIPILGDALADELKEQIAANDVDAENIVLLKKINKALTYKTIVHAMPKIVSTVDELGVYEQFDSMNLTIEAKDKARNEFVSFRIREADKDGESNLNALRKFLNDNAVDYPLYVVPAETVSKINTKERGVYAVL